jgi:predicted Zn finger-like uncharacterized protein
MNNACPSCGAIYNVAAKDIGRRIKCKKCQTALIVTESGLEADQPAASPPPPPAAAAAPAFEDVAADDDDEEVAPPRKGKGKDRGRRYAGPAGPSLGERLAQVGGIPTIVMGFGAFLVIVFLFMPIIGQAAIQRAEALKSKLEQEQGAKVKKLTPVGKKDITPDDLKKIQDDTEKIRKDYEKQISDAEDDARAERTSNQRAVWFERYGMMFGFLFVMVAALMYMMPDQPPIKRVVGAIILTAQLVLVFIAFIIRGAATG